MRLSKIKLAGFKSFVDPTTIPFPSDLTGIVGPNGCGKSNVIDAVRWVMGESSAKHLRGDTMADVIFNGSSSRKPVGHATIELVFDNSDGGVGGQYASYAEISVKRVVMRDGQSHYFLNGARCRRKDITGLFLGTGLGPRSYAIIEQGMISRFIEAKPEELRMFLEEAAGISKYKERRRETENRIRHTRENLDRISDLQQELEKQLAHLNRQAKVAEKYKHLKQEERRLRAQLLALRWKSSDTEAGAQQVAIREQETQYEAQAAIQRSLEAEIEKRREEHLEATDEFNRVQAEYYSVGAEIARIEQAIQHAREKRQQLERDLEQANTEYEKARIDLEADQRRLQELTETLTGSDPALEKARSVEEQSTRALALAEEAMQDWQIDWDEFNLEAAEPLRAAEVEQARIQHLEQYLAHLEERLQRFEQQKHAISGEAENGELGVVVQELATVESELKQAGDDMGDCGQQIIKQRETISSQAEALDAGHGLMQELQGRLASLEALQEAALGKRQVEVTTWLDKRGLGKAARLAEEIVVNDGWERAVETVLGFHLEAVCVADSESLGRELKDIGQGALGLFDTSKVGSNPERGDIATALLDHVESSWQLGPLLAGVYTAEALNEALAMRDRLGTHESVVTREGIWLGANWIRIARDADERAGVLTREQEIKETDTRLAQVRAEVELQEREYAGARRRLHELEQRRDEKQAELNGITQRYADLRARISASKASLEQIRNQRERLEHDSAEVQQQIVTSRLELGKAQARLVDARETVREHEVRRSELQKRRDQFRERLDYAREQAHAERETAHRILLKVESARSALESTREAQGRVDARIRQLEIRRRELRTTLEEGESPVHAMQDELDTHLALRLKVESDLNDARKRMQDIDHAMQEAAKTRNEVEQQAESIRAALDEKRLAYQTIHVRSQTIEEQIAETQYHLQELIEGLPENVTEEEWQVQVEKMEKRIQRLGAINLAAIDEFTELSERKEYLDSQLKDLNDALQTLENAMRKIDRETRERFKETYDKVNVKLQEMYPRLFGGGTARLELEGDDLLSSGIVVMARPPGKRISSIHLMSGGEKALTAVAMVFSIFELNPAPFCLLDEVDAPLDDSNVVRFCDLLSEMSERVQFIFITHNKLTMEMARHLTGVTMQEPGVSRIVAVDVDEAAAMVAV